MRGRLFKMAGCCLVVLALSACGAARQVPGKPYHHTSAGFRNPEGSPERNSWIVRFPWVLGRLLGVFGAAEGRASPRSRASP